MLLAIYFLLAGMIVQRQPILWVMPITSTMFAALHSMTLLLAPWTSKRYNTLSPMQQSWCCSLLCQLVFSAVAFAAAALLLLAHPLELLPKSLPLPLPEAAVQLLTRAGPAVLAPIKLISDSIIGGSAAGALVAAANVQQLATLLTCAAAGYYAFRLWLLVRSRAVHHSGQLLALFQYTLLLVVYSVASYKGSQVRWLRHADLKQLLVELSMLALSALIASTVYSIIRPGVPDTTSVALQTCQLFVGACLGTIHAWHCMLKATVRPVAAVDEHSSMHELAALAPAMAAA
jgi:hypothetical protein